MIDHSFSHNWQLRKAVVRSAGGVVASQSRRAADAGAAILRAGGNAIDAAVATSFTVGVLENWMNGLGGGGCMLIYVAREKRVYAVDFTMVAPLGIDPADYPLTGSGGGSDLFGWPGVLEDRNIHGPLSIAVPGYVAGIGLALDSFGTKRLPELMAPAIAHAESGLLVDWYATLMIATGAKELKRYPESAAIWLDDGVPPIGQWSGAPKMLPFPKLARTLRHIAENGAESFYRGPLAERIVADMQAVGAKVSLEDLARYEARIVEPIRLSYRGFDVHAMSGLTAGPTVAKCFAALAARPASGGRAPDTAQYLAYATTLRDAYAERLETMGEAEGTKEPVSTTHLAAIDREGNMVTITQTLLSLFGSRVTLPSTGVLMNNGVMWFDPRPGRPNSIAPGRRPLNNMCPVVVTEGGEPRFAIGASGGRRIMPAVMQIAAFQMDHGMGLEEAFHQPRLDVSGPEGVTADPRLPQETLDALSSRFPTTVFPRMVYPKNYACPVAVAVEQATGERLGTCEPSQPWGDGAPEV
ncbi:MAG: gamma-glutamyltransferase [Alphaproteobacteria bacterium]|nr:gamma-glutamyltransferase [Alphaproteobacteria bacterium]